MPLGNSEALSGLYLLSEIRDASSLFLSERILALIGKHSDILESMHISDQYTGFIQETSVTGCTLYITRANNIVISWLYSDDSDVVVVKKPQKRLRITFKGVI